VYGESLSAAMPKLAHFRAKHDAAPLPPDVTPILHVDMDAFFVSVELLERPELRGKPVVVGGQPNRRGVVSAASYEARRFGIHSAMPLRTAGRLCPQAVFLEGRHALYAQWSDRVAAILAKFTPVVEMASIDEAYLDLSGTERLHGPHLAAAHALLQQIDRETHLPCSAGLARTRLVAKVASDQAKPRGLLWVPAGAEADFLAPLGVRRIPGIGKVTEAALHKLKIERVDQLAAMSQEQLEEVFGRWGTALHRKSRGEDSYEFFVDAEPKSISHSHTFGVDTRERAVLEAMLSRLCQKAGKRLREAGLDAQTVTVTIRYAGFETVTRAKSLPEPVHLDPIFMEMSQRLFERNWDHTRSVRLIGVELGSLSHGTSQLDLLDPTRRAKLEKLARAADLLRDRFGFGKVQFGGSLGSHADEEDDPQGEV
jgi:DNA polymerase-4